mgnify:CR=1 FL=1|jgi:two-component system response regulator HydG
MIQDLRILIVDDDRRMTRTLADILSLSGYEAVEAYSGYDALAKIRNMLFDCVITDIRMPGMNGIELHQQMRRAQPGLPVLLMTAYAATELIHQSLDDGVVGVFDKPLDVNQLLAFLSSLAKNRTVVIVDDDSDFCQTLGDILTRRGFRVAPITDPHTDVEQMAADVQVILLDMKLNDINGLDVLMEIRQRYPVLPVLLVTGYRQEMTAVIQRALEINAYTCLYKPLEIPKLLQTLAQVQLECLRSLLKNSY